MELYVLVTKRTKDKEPEFVTNVRNYGFGYSGRVRVYDNIRAAHSARTILTKKGVDVAILRLDTALGVEVE